MTVVTRKFGIKLVDEAQITIVKKIAKLASRALGLRQSE